MTKQQFATNISDRIKAIDMTAQNPDVAGKVSVIVAEETDSFVRDLSITVTIPAMTVVNEQTQEVTVNAVIDNP